MAEVNNAFKKKTTSPSELLLIFILGTVVCTYIGFLCGAVWTEDSDLSSFLNDFTRFVIEERHFIVGVTGSTPVFILIFDVSFAMVFLIMTTSRQFPYAGEEYGNAKWGNAAEFTKAYANHDKKNEVMVNPGDAKLDKPLIVNTHNYWLAEGVYISIDNVRTSNLNMLVVGPPGCGKTFRFVKPILSNLAGNYVVTDPKGELYQQTGQYFEDNGYEVMVLNVESEEGMPMSIHFNPFRYITNEEDILSLSQILMKATSTAEGSSNDQFFEQSAETLLISILYLMHFYYPKEMQTWRTFVDLLDATTVFTKADGSIDIKKCRIMEVEKKANLAWRQHHDTDFPGYIAVEKYYHGAAETTSSIVASLDAHCRYMKLSCVIDLLSEDEVNILNTFGYSRKNEYSPTGKRILYMVTSEDKRYYDWITSMVYLLFFESLYHLTTKDTSLHGSLPNHLTLLMDEFSNISMPDDFVDRLSTMRSRNMSAIMIVQNLIQLKKKYPNNDQDKNLIGQCDIKTVLGAPDKDSCEYLSPLFGKTTIYKKSDSDSRDHKGSSSQTTDVLEMPLVSVDKLQGMKKDGPLLIRIGGTDPLSETKCQMERTPFIKLLCRKEKTYDPKTSLHKRRMANRKSMGKMSCGEEAKERCRKLKSEGVSVIHLSEEDVQGLVMAGKTGYQTKGIALSKAEKAMLKKNFENFQEKHDTEAKLDFSVFWNGSKDRDEYLQKACTAKELLVKGYSVMQVKEMVPLIANGITSTRLYQMFTTNSSKQEIQQTVNAMVGGMNADV